MPKLCKQTSLAVAAGIGFSLATISASFSLEALTPGKTKILLAQRARAINKNEILAAHNKYRRSVRVPPLQWSDTVASSAQQWANQLARTSRFEHSNNRRYGENLWMGTAGRFSFTQMVDGWGSEKQYFIPNRTFPNVSNTGKWQDVGHYTQVIWRNTRQVGCALASGGGNDYLVCQYSPPGNVIGQRVY
ncbi:CAP domain-containing protein [Microseira sp. BLCC-F43]|uniref:CAP domain-containing protein n=1 Tax=Microseira sp. BLCC-F43 TaxID=3153602 RepID=UPI0035B8469B